VLAKTLRRPGPRLGGVRGSKVTVETSYEDGIFTVGFAAGDGAGALLFSRSDAVDTQDALLGMDAYCVSTERGATFYGGVESAWLSGTGLELRLRAEAAEALGLPTELVLRLRDDEAVEAAVDALGHVGIIAAIV
jgi:hypothetical protein